MLTNPTTRSSPGTSVAAPLGMSDWLGVGTKPFIEYTGLPPSRQDTGTSLPTSHFLALGSVQRVA